MIPQVTFEQGLDLVADLVKRFSRNAAAYRGPAYNEAQARIEFINPFFEALGWDVQNRSGKAPQYRAVVYEFSVEVEGVRKAPDYAFRIGREPKFFTEAKKPGVNLKADANAAYQLRTYGWNVKLPLSLLTDFEELAVYDCRARPAHTDKAGVGRVQYYTCEEYADRWRELWDVFSYRAVETGAFDNYTASARGKRGTSEVDAEFLREIERWRDVLARNMALRNPRLSVDELNDAVQRTIDRIIFLRMAEDRDIEPYEQLLRLTQTPTPSLHSGQAPTLPLPGGGQGGGIYADLMDLCRRADARYNSGLFDLKADTVTPRLAVDDKALAPILADLYFPKSPYRFNLLHAEILGNVYEQFLGKVIRLTPAHQAKVEEKPQVKKAGGVYYTPSYIVDYIVKNTVGQRVEGKSPKQLESFRVLDPACGSGSFLLGAYQYLLDYYLNWYTDHMGHSEARSGGVEYNAESLPRKPETLRVPSLRGGAQGDKVYQAKDGSWRLTTAEKKRILTAHIFGVDIDRQAVEVTKLSLLLKVLEGESDETLGQQLALFQERALPNLDSNIKCGNSLIGPDYFTGQLLPDPDELRRVNPFDWEREFPDAMKVGGPSASSGQGFDCVIGNPPYIRIQTMKEWAPLEVEAYKQLYSAASSGNYDIYVVFVEQGLSLLNRHGRLGFILPHKFFNAQYGEPLRSLLATGKHLSHVVHFGGQQVFAGATTYTCLMFLDKAGSDECHLVKVDNLAAWRSDLTGLARGVIPAAHITAAEWNFTVGKGAALFERLSKMPVKLGDIAFIFVGLQTSADTVFLFKDTERSNKKITKVYSKELDREVEVESTLLKPVVRSGCIQRYWATPTAQVLFPYHFQNGKAQLVSETDMKRGYPKAWAYLSENKQLLASREHGKFKDTGWYQLYPKNLDVWEQPKIMIPYMITDLAAYHDTDDTYFVNVTTGGFGITIDSQHGRLGYFTGLLNSHLLDWFLKNVSTTFHGGYFAANKQFLVQLPIRPINFSDPADVARHDRIVALVEQMLELHKRLAAASEPLGTAPLGTAGDRELYQRQIDATDREIDKLVYELYGLTDEEIKIVEGE